MASADAPPLTLRLLLTMSAGFPSDDPWADRQESLSIDAFDSFLRAGPRFSADPGTEYRYSNLGYAIVGRAVSNVSGQPYQRFVTERFLQPLEMDATCFSSADVPAEHLVTGHRRVADEWRPEPFDHPGEFSPIGGLYSTVADLAIWVTGFSNASAIPVVPDRHPLGVATRRGMQQLHRLSEVSTSAVGDDLYASAKGYGMGLTLERHTYWGDVVGHSGGYPGFGSNMRWHLASGVGVIALANSTYAAPGSAAAAMLEQVLRGGAPRHRPPVRWPELNPMRTAVDRLLGEWDDELADELFAVNVDLDQPRAERREQITSVVEQLGEIDLGAPADEECPSAAELDWTLTGSRGRARVEIGLSPESTPRIQSLSVRLLDESAKILTSPRPEPDPAIHNEQERPCPTLSTPTTNGGRC